MSTIRTAESEKRLKELAKVLQPDECLTCPCKSKCTWYISGHQAEIEAIKQDVLQTLPHRQVHNL